MMSFERMDRLGIISDAEMELERIEKEKREGKKPKNNKLISYHINMGSIWEVREYPEEHRGVSSPIINIKQAMGRYSHHLNNIKPY